jgi:hypothetical protein
MSKKTLLQIITHHHQKPSDFINSTQGQQRSNTIHEQKIPTTFPGINVLPTMANEIKNIINSLKSKNSCSYDGISTKLLNTCSDYISVPLSYLCNQSLIEGTFPK